MSAATNKPLDPNQVAVAHQPPLPPKLDLPRCTLCDGPYDTDLTKLQRSVNHRLPVSCLNCSRCICFNCLQNEIQEQQDQQDREQSSLRKTDTHTTSLQTKTIDWIECRQCGQPRINAQKPFINRQLCEMLKLNAQLHGERAKIHAQVAQAQVAQASLQASLQAILPIDEIAVRNDERAKMLARLAQASQAGALVDLLVEWITTNQDDLLVEGDTTNQDDLLIEGDATANQDDDDDDSLEISPLTQPEAASMPMPQDTEPSKRDPTPE